MVKMGTTTGTRLSGAPHSHRGGHSGVSCGSESGCHPPMGTSEGEKILSEGENKKAEEQSNISREAI